MEVKQVRQRMSELEDAIGDLIAKFQTETGCIVEQVSVGRSTMLCGVSLAEPPRIVSMVTVEVRL